MKFRSLIALSLGLIISLSVFGCPKKPVKAPPILSETPIEAPTMVKDYFNIPELYASEKDDIEIYPPKDQLFRVFEMDLN